jgi:hypothetical protein
LESGAFLVDPLFIVNNLTPALTVAQITDTIGRFPFPAGTDPSTKPAVFMRRVLPDNTSGFVTSPFPINYTLNLDALKALFNRTFVWPDDQVFPIPENSQGRPSRSVDAGGAGHSEGAYSWMATVSPAVAEMGQATGGKTMFDVSVVVFCKRDLSTPLNPTDPEKSGERIIRVQFSGGGQGGGSALLTQLANDTHANTLDIRENDWILLGGRETLGPTQSRPVFAWYRMTGVGEQNSPNQRAVTLVGSDWNPGWTVTLDGAPCIQGVICTGVIGVYTKMLELN